MKAGRYGIYKSPAYGVIPVRDEPNKEGTMDEQMKIFDAMITTISSPYWAVKVAMWLGKKEEMTDIWGTTVIVCTLFGKSYLIDHGDEE